MSTAVVKQAASALIATGHSKDTIFNIYASTSPRWQAIANGTSSLELKGQLQADPFVQPALPRVSRSRRRTIPSAKKGYVPVPPPPLPPPLGSPVF